MCDKKSGGVCVWAEDGYVGNGGLEAVGGWQGEAEVGSDTKESNPTTQVVFPWLLLP